MKNTYNEDSENSVLNDYEESIMFDEDDPDFKRNEDFKLNDNSLYRYETNGKFT